jgi:hypothetical protein
MSDDIIRVIDETYRRVGRIESRDVYGNLEWKYILSEYASIPDLRVLYTGRNYTTGTVYDSSGTFNDANIEGVLGTILLFNDHATFEMDGATSFRAPSNTSLSSVGGTITLGAWVYLFATPQEDWGVISKGTANQFTGGIDYALAIYEGTPRFQVRSSAIDYTVYGNVLKKEAWYYLVGKAVDGFQLSLRINRDLSFGNTLPIGQSITSSNHPLMVGALGTEAYYPFFGQIALPFISGYEVDENSLDFLYYRSRPFFGNPLYNDPDAPEFSSLTLGSTFGTVTALAGTFGRIFVDIGTFGKSVTTTADADRFISGSFVGGTFAGSYGSFANAQAGFGEINQASLGSGSVLNVPGPALRFQADADTGIYQPGTTNIMSFAAGGTEWFRVQQFGTITGAQSLGTMRADNIIAVNGISFTNQSALANQLDEYEEGTFTPTIAGATTAGTGTYTAQNGAYTRIGRVVAFQIRIIWTNHTGTGNLRVRGLPFTVGSGNSVPPFTTNATNLALTAGSVIANGQSLTSTTEIILYQTPSGGGALAEIPMDTAATIWIQGFYYA